MSSSATATKITTKRGGTDDVVMGKVPIYQYVMTPIIFVSFLVSLAWVDLRYSIRRSQDRKSSSKLPGWLHHLLYRKTAPMGPHDGYYHSKQKKLAKMEMADAFEIRGTVVAVLFVLSASMSWGVWSAGCWAWGAVMSEAI